MGKKCFVVAARELGIIWDGQDGDNEVGLMEIRHLDWKRSIIFQGIEFRQNEEEKDPPLTMLFVLVTFGLMQKLRVQQEKGRREKRRKEKGSKRSSRFLSLVAHFRHGFNPSEVFLKFILNLVVLGFDDFLR
uniref:Uncharacterized protein n=1 Tax=Solanum tuberosum TaxID=4113 RepID=M1D9L3_SOLTU